MEKQKPYLSFSHPPPRPTSFLFKKAAEKNAALMRELSLEEQREARERLADVRVVSPGARFASVECGGVPCEWVCRDDHPEDKAILYIHGGSWAFGTLRTARPVALVLGALTGCRVLVCQYRLAPEHPFPAAAHDCSMVYRWLTENGFSAENLGIFGDSAGGNLSLSLIHRLIAQGRPLPAALGLASPVPDMSEHSMLAKDDPDLLYTRCQGEERHVFSLYCGENDRQSPLISPVYGDLSGFPPMLIHVGQDEALYVDCDVFAQKAHDAGVDVALKIWRDMYHDFTIVGYTLKESRQSLAEFAAFYQKHLAL